MNQYSLASFFSGLDASLKQVRKFDEMYKPTMAQKFNALNFLRPNENSYSEILAYFLNPSEEHGQGDIFLKLFLEGINADPKASELLTQKATIKVKTEYSTFENRRIDIVITFEGNEKYAIGIENKKWANDQLNQLLHYDETLLKLFGQNYILFYLTPWERDPSPHSIGKTALVKLQKITYSAHIVPIVEKWITHCKAMRVQVFLTDFLNYIKQHLLAENNMIEKKTVVDFIKSNPDYIKTAFEVANSAEALKAELWRQFVENSMLIFNEIESEFGYSLKYNNSDCNYLGFIDNKRQLANLTIFFRIDFENYKNIYYGIEGDILNCSIEQKQALRLKVANLFSEFKPNKDKLLFILEHHSEWSQDTLINLPKSDFASFIKEKLVFIVEKLKKIEDQL